MQNSPYNVRNPLALAFVVLCGAAWAAGQLRNVDIAETILPSKGGTGIASYTIGDLIYASGATTLSKLASPATGRVLVSGGVGVAPAWTVDPSVGSLTASASEGLKLTGTPTASGTSAVAQIGAAPVGGSSNGQMAWINAPAGFAGYYLGAQTNGAAPSFLVAHNALTVGNGAGNAGLVFNGGAGANRDFTYQSGGVTRWLLRVSATAESGSNVGSDFQFIPFSDAGSALPTAITMKRSTSDIIVGTNLIAGVSAKFSNIATAANTTDTTPTIYATTTTGGAYPFLTAGNLVYQTRPSGANRDHVFIGGTTQAVQTVIGAAGLSVLTGAPATAALDVAGNAKFKRRIGAGTAHVAGDWAASGWGASAVVTITGTDSRGTVTVTTNAADTPSASPTLTLTYKDGAWASAPFAVASWDDNATGPIASVSTKTTTTTLVLKYHGTPTATSALTYKFSYHVNG